MKSYNIEQGTYHLDKTYMHLVVSLSIQADWKLSLVGRDLEFHTMMQIVVGRSFHQRELLRPALLQLLKEQQMSYSKIQELTKCDPINLQLEHLSPMK
jgi:hypothetical protein